MPAPLRLLVVDDHPMVRQGLVALFELNAEVELVGEGADGEAAVALYEELRPDVLVMDVGMPGVDGVEATRRILRAHPQAKVLIISGHDDDAQVLRALRVGARGYVLK